MLARPQYFKIIVHSLGINTLRKTFKLLYLFYVMIFKLNLAWQDVQRLLQNHAYQEMQLVSFVQVNTHARTIN